MPSKDNAAATPSSVTAEHWDSREQIEGARSRRAALVFSLQSPSPQRCSEDAECCCTASLRCWPSAAGGVDRD